MRPKKMALWNEFLPEQLQVDPTTERPKLDTTDEAMRDEF